jgi:hypothetical protein
MSSFWIRGPFLSLVLALLASGQAGASSLSVFKGKYGGVLLITQGTANLPANADTKVKAIAKSAKFTVKGTLNGKAYTYVISLANGQATVSTLFPGGTGSVFGKSATGTFKAHGKSVAITITNPGNIISARHASRSASRMRTPP